MTAVRSAGYTSAGKRPGTAFDPTGQGGGKGPAPALQKRSDNSPEDLCREMEKEVNHLIEESAQLNIEKRYSEALEKAKDAGKRERKLCQLREDKNLADQINIDLTYSVFFNLANQYHANGLYAEALKSYSEIVKNKQYHQSGRLRVNMGNIYFEQRKYPNAIKMYRMALDQIPNTGREMRSKIIRNIGVAFVRLGQFQDAIASFEQVLDGGSPDVQTGFNLLLCYYALDEPERMRKVFGKLLTIRAHGQELEDEDELAVGVDDVLRDDGLKEELRLKHKLIAKHLLIAAKLLAPKVEADVAAGYEWAATQLRNANYTSLANEIEIGKSLHFMRTRQFDLAVETLKSYERKDTSLVARAATNLSFIYFHEGDYPLAVKYADVAMKHNRYNAKALVNKGNVLYMNGELDMARKVRADATRRAVLRCVAPRALAHTTCAHDMRTRHAHSHARMCAHKRTRCPHTRPRARAQMFMESMGADADCIEAIYNLGLVNKQLGLHGEALALFEKLHGILPASVEVLWQLADLHELVSPADTAIKWFNKLESRVPNDPGVLARLGNLFLKEQDEAQAYHFYAESYRFYPVDMNVISWLGAYFVQNEMYERAITYFERAAQIQPHEFKWQLMVASCHRRAGDYPIAYEIYTQIHKRWPDNVECARRPARRERPGRTEAEAPPPAAAVALSPPPRRSPRSRRSLACRPQVFAADRGRPGQVG
jgi:intraflagellar transport protein 88